MHSFVFPFQLTRHSDSLHYLILRFPARTFSGLVGEVSPPPVNYTRLLMHLDSSRFFKVGSPKNWIFAFTGLWAVSDLERSVLDGSIWLFCIWHFWRELRRCLVNPRTLSAELVIDDTFQYSRRSPSCHQVAFFIRPLLYDVILGGITLVPWFPYDYGLWHSQRDCFAIAINVPDISPPTYCYRRTLKKKVSLEDLTFSL